MTKSTGAYTEEDRKRNRMRLIDIREVNNPLKSAKVSAGQECGCENGLEGITIPIRVMEKDGSGINP
ncbi:MAG: hypothetical protein C5S49_04100 [Candidatus Methanogaster sp.]|nr:MAG: hypothetical protein C5S49_04100 [ANME-2 cluster archaeon]